MLDGLLAEAALAGLFFAGLLAGVLRDLAAGLAAAVAAAIADLMGAGTCGGGMSTILQLLVRSAGSQGSSYICSYTSSLKALECSW